MTKRKIAPKAAVNHAATQEIARNAWRVAFDAGKQLNQLRVQFRAIREELGGLGNAATLAASGCHLAKVFCDDFDLRANRIRDALEDAAVPEEAQS